MELVDEYSKSIGYKINIKNTKIQNIIKKEDAVYCNNRKHKILKNKSNKRQKSKYPY